VWSVKDTGPPGEEADMRDDLFDADHLMAGIFVTAAVGLALVLVPTGVAVPVLVAVAFACGRLGGRDAGLGSVAVGALLFGYAITQPHFVWEIESGVDQVLLVVLFVASLIASELGARRRLHALRRADGIGSDGTGSDRPSGNGNSGSGINGNGIGSDGLGAGRPGR
jgi:K+-sensing histidine kinase KdpD